MRVCTEDFERWSLSLDRVVYSADDRAVALFRQFASGKESGVPVEQEFALLYDFEGGRATRMRIYADAVEAVDVARGVTIGRGGLDEQTNIAIATRAAEAASQTPRPDFEAINALYHPDHEFSSALSELEGQSFHGISGYRQWLAAVGDAFEYGWKVEELSALDEHRVLARFHLVGRGKGSGVPFEQDLWGVMTVRDGKVARTEVHATREEALRAAGIDFGTDGTRQ